MRILPTIVLLAWAISSSPSGSRAGASAEPPLEPGKLDVRVDGKSLSIGSKKVPVPGDRKALVEVLGPPSRVVEKVNTLLVWDELGLLAYERPKGGPVIQVTIAVGDLSRSIDFWPRKRFNGTLSLDGAPVTASSSIDAINRARTGRQPALRPQGVGVRWEVDHGDVSVVILKARGGRFDPEGTIAEFLIESKRLAP
jgi:hypothetical protein